MTDFGTLSAHDAPQPRDGIRSDGRPSGLSGAPGGAAHSRFGAAAGILDRLDTRPLAMRLRRRPWWRFW